MLISLMCAGSIALALLSLVYTVVTSKMRKRKARFRSHINRLFLRRDRAERNQ